MKGTATDLSHVISALRYSGNTTQLRVVVPVGCN